jgi:predicted phosphodiesterase
MTAPAISIVHLSDLHFGGYADLVQIEALEDFLPTLGAAATVVSGDLTQRARHGEFQAAHAFLRRLRAHAPLLVVPGNHDLEWWKSPLGLAGGAVKYAKYARYFGDLTPVLTIPGAVIAGALSSYGVAFGSLTWNLNDVAVKGHLPASETTRVTKVFAEAPAEAVRILTFHHNVLRGGISRRMGLANWRAAYRRLLATGADVILCGHDHHEGAGQIEGALAVSTAGTHSFRTRGGRPSVFNLVRIDDRAVHIRHYRWEAAGRQFLTSDMNSFARQGSPRVAVSVAGGSGPVT